MIANSIYEYMIMDFRWQFVLIWIMISSSKFYTVAAVYTKTHFYVF